MSNSFCEPGAELFAGARTRISREIGYSHPPQKYVVDMKARFCEQPAFADVMNNAVVNALGKGHTKERISRAAAAYTYGGALALRLVEISLPPLIADEVLMVRTAEPLEQVSQMFTAEIGHRRYRLENESLRAFQKYPEYAELLKDWEASLMEGQTLSAHTAELADGFGVTLHQAEVNAHRQYDAMFNNIVKGDLANG